jgi:hypothetical protein
MPLTRPRVIAITLLAVLVALGSASLFAQNGSSATTVPTIQLTPTEGCPGQQITVAATFPFTDAALLATPGSAGVAPVIITSDPDGLISKGTFELTENLGIEVRGTFIVGDVCAGPYRVTLKIAPPMSDGQPETLPSVSTSFTVGGNGCPNLPSCLRPVGGVVMPINTLAITAPYLALAGLIVAVSAVVVVKRRSKD